VVNASYFSRIRDRSKEGLGNFMPKERSVSAKMPETARLRYHFLFAGMMNHGAALVLQRDSAANAESARLSATGV
jgi:hypothetical protein